ncbi:hypothetical protein TSAR_006717 [Trichomalopsis sarcophagae]|uniref:Uncharacterized protein n=1 Tax=Trichomalopsis sarcophagae TaxID=543379 RepID=A0A232ENA0_9HYME|nr:hypothetical protein TSAR_006717 [Trichomalopsis sarcophagae]
MDEVGKSYLYLAARTQNLWAPALLLQQGASVKEKERGNCTLVKAALDNNSDILVLLWSLGASSYKSPSKTDGLSEPLARRYTPDRPLN